MRSPPLRCALPRIHLQIAVCWQEPALPVSNLPMASAAAPSAEPFSPSEEGLSHPPFLPSPPSLIRITE